MLKEPLIKIENVGKCYEKKGLFATKAVHAVDNLSFTVDKNEILGIVGESGSGKTTLVRMILGLEKPTTGKIWMNGMDVHHQSRVQKKEFHQKVSVVFQDPGSNFNPHFTVGMSIMRPLLIHGEKKEEAYKKAEKALELVNLDPSIMNIYPKSLSGGQQQRVAIARAIILQPEVIILDESTSALDISVQAQVLLLLLSLQKQFGMTFIFISHDLNVIKYMCDRIVVMHQGKAVEMGTTEQVICHTENEYTKRLLAAVPHIENRK